VVVVVVDVVDVDVVVTGTVTEIVPVAGTVVPNHPVAAITVTAASATTTTTMIKASHFAFLIFSHIIFTPVLFPALPNIGYIRNHVVFFFFSLSTSFSVLYHFHGNIDADRAAGARDNARYRVTDNLRPVQNNHRCPSRFPELTHRRPFGAVKTVDLSNPISLE
jgi:hypothetical protein